MRLQNKHDGTFLTISVHEYHDNMVYYRANYTDVTPPSSPKQTQQRQNYIKLGQLHSLRTQLRAWGRQHSHEVKHFYTNEGRDVEKVLSYITKEIDELTAKMKGKKSE